MKLKSLFPTEHGVTAIWLYSTLAGILSPKEFSNVLSLCLAAVVSLTLYILISLFIRASKITVFVRNSEVSLILGSVSLTLFMLINNYIIIGSIRWREAAIWLLLASYTTATTLSAKLKVRSLVSNTERRDLPLLIGFSVLLFECITLTFYGIFPYTILLALPPLTLPHLIHRLSKKSERARSKKIKSLGVSYMSSGITFATIISLH